jgi:hypothetical protein
MRGVLRLRALLRNPVLADGARVVLAAPPHHRSHALIHEEDAAKADRAEGYQKHAAIFVDRARLRNLTTAKRLKMRRAV